MKKQEYDAVQNTLLFYAQLLQSSNEFSKLDEFITAIDRAEITGPLLDAKLYREGQEKMDRIKTIAKAVNKAKKEIEPALDFLIEHQDDTPESI